MSVSFEPYTYTGGLNDLIMASPWFNVNQGLNTKTSDLNTTKSESEFKTETKSSRTIGS